MGLFLDKLKALRVATKKWERRQKNHLKRELNDIERELDSISHSMFAHTLHPNTKSKIQFLEKRRTQILLINEMTWKIKSCVTWLKEGDQNTEKFHRFSNHHRQKNSIWEIFDSDDTKYQMQDEIS